MSSPLRESSAGHLRPMPEERLPWSGCQCWLFWETRGVQAQDLLPRCSRISKSRHRPSRLPPNQPPLPPPSQRDELSAWHAYLHPQKPSAYDHRQCLPARYEILTPASRSPVREPPNNQIKGYNIWLTKRFPVPFPTAMLACLLLLFAIKVGEAHV